MRLERLELEGFTAYRDRTEVDFAGVELFALTGPTGAGKSSLVDAVCFALYGIVPRYGDKRLVAPVISEGKVEAKVRLDFRVGGEGYTAVRVVRAQRGGATTKEARLARADGEVLAGNADELTAAVESLLGLTFAHFTTCVVLPQGEFMRFLHAKPRERQDLLVELLDLGVYGRMRELARSREAAARARREGADQQLASLEPLADADRLRGLDAEIATLAGLLERIEEVQPRLDELAKEADAARAAADAARAEATLLTRVSRPADLDALGGARAEAEAAVAAARQGEEGAARRLADVEAAAAGRPARADLDALVRAREEHADVRARVARGHAVVEGARHAADAARGQLDAASRARESARAAVEAAGRDERARVLLAGLHAGDRCPVCAQEVHVLPAIEPAEVDTAMAVAAAADAAHDHADQVARAAVVECEKAEALLATRLEQLAALDERLAGSPDPDELARQLAAIDEADTALAAARAGRDEAQAARQRAERSLDAARTGEAAARRAFSAARDAVVPLGPPPADHDDLAADWEALLSWAASEQPVREARAEEAGGRARAAEAAATELVDTLVDECEAAGLDVGGRVVRDVVIDRLADARADRASVAAAIEAVAALGAARDTYHEAEQVAAVLVRHLGAAGFEKWVLDEVLQGLVAGATGVLHDLSGGTYSLTLEAKTSNFSVVDHANADAVRSARTLSGGETFLASLALALALADQIARLGPGGGARLESIFLDEGFGTLDADTLDTVAAAIEELGARGRMVGLISHVPELAERLPVRFAVSKGPAGSTVERIDA